MEQAHRQQRGTRSAKDKSTGMDHPEWQRGQAEKKKRERGSLSEEECARFRRELKELTPIADGWRALKEAEARREEAEALLGTPVRITFRVGEPKPGAPQENLKSLLKFGRQFDNVDIQ